MTVELYPLFDNLSIDLLLLDSNCNIIDSVSGVGTIIHDFIISNEDFYTIKIRNSDSSIKWDRNVGLNLTIKPLNYQIYLLLKTNVLVFLLTKTDDYEIKTSFKMFT